MGLYGSSAVLKGIEDPLNPLVTTTLENKV